MIELVAGPDIAQLLGIVADRPERYHGVTVCSPFIDEAMAEVLARIVVTGRAARCGVRVVTYAPGAARILNRLPGPRAEWTKAVVANGRVHAKVYLAAARRYAETEAIVTSANLTTAGTSHNVELGVRVRPSSEAGRQLLAHVETFVRRLAA
jgi:phosphatidylserine/phosphatidylglycerophosphate/cardiolipin synthase-like enzyme